jgi:hypothetical protein
VINIVLWLAGLVLLVLGITKAAGPYRRMTELDRLADNARRYESWRGGSRLTAADGETTGADVMRAMMRRQTITWAGVAVLGIVLIFGGFTVR